MDGLFESLHEEIGITVLSHLPQKSLLKFRSVSKSWRDTIDSSIFRNLHAENQIYNNCENKSRRNDDDKAFLQLIHSAHTWKLSMRLEDSKKSSENFPAYQNFFINHMFSGMLAFSEPVHGLICLYEYYSCERIALCNPSLGKIKILPPATTSSPFYSLHNVGFGYDDLKRDFKVVQTWHERLEWRTVVEVYSRRENTWRVFADHPLHRNLAIIKTIRRLRPWMSAGVVHWYGCKWLTVANNEVRKSVLISFDMCSEEFKMIELPFVGCSEEIDIVAKDDSILVFISLLPSEIRGVDIWEYKREWIKIVRVLPLDEVTSWMSDGLVFEIISDTKLVIYDYCTKKEIQCIDLGASFLEIKDQREKIEYMGSFISP